MAKIHLKISVDPLHGGEDVEAFCGEIVTLAEALPLSDSPDFEPTGEFKICRKCISRYLIRTQTKNYVYAITSGQGALDAQRGRE